MRHSCWHVCLEAIVDGTVLASISIPGKKWPFYVLLPSSCARPMMMALSPDGSGLGSGVMLSANAGLTMIAKFGSSRLAFQLHNTNGGFPQISPEETGHLPALSMRFIIAPRWVPSFAAPSGDGAT